MLDPKSLALGGYVSKSKGQKIIHEICLLKNTKPFWGYVYIYIYVLGWVGRPFIFRYTTIYAMLLHTSDGVWMLESSPKMVTPDPLTERRG